MTFDVISIGSSLVDIFLNFPKQKLTPGEKIDLETMKVFSGGGGTNTAVGFARLGLKAGIVSETGKDNFAYIVLNELQREGVDISMVIQEKLEETGGSVMLVGKDGGRTALVHRGASSMLDPFDISPFWISQTRWVHLSNIAGQEKTLRKIFELVKANEQTHMSWNPGKQELQLIADGKLAIADLACKVLILNDEEWAMVEKQQQELIKEIPEIVVTQGEKGGFVYVDGKKSMKFLGASVNSVDDTGAGDAFCTGYVAGQLFHQSPKTCVEWGVRNAGAVISKWGAKLGLLDRTQIQSV